jgi:hypothetical protein
LLDQGFKIDAEEKVKLIDIATVAHMDQDGIQKLRRSYDNASRDILDLLRDDEDYSAISKIAKEMGSDG